MQSYENRSFIYDGSILQLVGTEKRALMKHKKPLFIEGNGSLYEPVKQNYYNW
jgi:hypothetical protein